MQRKLTCIYEPHTKTHKDDLIREIETLRGDNTSLLGQNKEMAETAMDLENRNKGLQETSDWQKIILDTIGSNGHDREIIRRLRAGESHQSIADWLSQLDTLSRDLQQVPVSQRSLIDVVGSIERHYQEDGLGNINSVDASPSIPWTTVCSSAILIGHLLDLYFAWVHPFHMLFSELDFKRDFRMHAEVYCSTSLVNAICAMACHLLESEVVDDQISGVDASTLCQAFMDDARASLHPNNFHHMTSIQTFAVMYLVDLGSGKAQNASKYLRTAVDSLKLNHEHEQSAEAIELSTWGIHTLNT